MTPSLYTFPSSKQQAQALAKALNFSCYDISIHHFPDKESLVTVPDTKAEHIIFYLSLEYPNNKLIELLFSSKAVRNRGCQRLTLIAPYLSYMRQDKSFNSGEVISQQVIGQWFDEIFDDVITVDPHLHRIKSLDSIMPDTNTITLTASHYLGEFVKSLNKEVHLMGPDEESLQWVQQVAEVSNSSFSVATKQRQSDSKVSIELPGDEFSNQHIILVDDVISTGHTVAETAVQLYKAKAKQVDVLVTHALFTENAMKTLFSAKIKNIWSSDSISHKTNHISLTDLLMAAVKTII